MRAYLKRIKGHAGYWSCERCVQPGTQCVINKKQPKNKQTSLGQSLASALHNNLSTTEEKKEKTTIQLLDLHAPRRTDEDFHTYWKKKKGDDDHLSRDKRTKQPLYSPLMDINFPMVTGFVIDSMHTLFGTLRRQLEGIAFNRNEGQISSVKLAAADNRLIIFKLCKPLEFDRHVRPLTKSVSKYKDHELRQMLYYLLYPLFFKILDKPQFENILLLPQSMLLLGSYNPDPVPAENILKATNVLKKHVSKLKEFKYPIRFLTHNIIHLPEDAENFECGIETLGAFIYENEMGIFRDMLGSGYHAVEQIRNRLAERNKYLLPTADNGMILTDSKALFKQATIQKQQEAGESHILLEFVDKGEKNKKKLRFAKFTITNKFPDNVCLMTNGRVLICTDIFRLPRTGEILLSGQVFKKIENPYFNSDFQNNYYISIASSIDSNCTELNIKGLRAKMYALPLPHPTAELKELPDITTCKITKWYLSPLFHCLY
jgi:hypothetical protein